MSKTLSQILLAHEAKCQKEEAAINAKIKQYYASDNGAEQFAMFEDAPPMTIPLMISVKTLYYPS